MNPCMIIVELCPCLQHTMLPVYVELYPTNILDAPHLQLTQTTRLLPTTCSFKIGSIKQYIDNKGEQ